MGEHENIFHQSTVCGSDVFDANHIYTEHLTNSLSTAYRGVRLSSSLLLNKTLQLNASYDVTSARIVSLDPRFPSANSYVIEDAEVPGVSIQSASVSFTGNPTNRRLGFNLQGTFVANNGNKFPRYILGFASLMRQIGGNSLDLSVMNIGNVNANRFSTLESASPYRLRDGEQIFLPDVSFTPREIRLRYTYSLGNR